MTDLPNPELFSAYLDGELTAEEEAQVEHLLATSAAARQLLEELRTLSQTLQALPSRSLEEDLSPHVLRAAERRVLAESTQPSRPAPARSWRELPGAALWGRLVHPRVIAWSALAVVVAVMVHFQDAHRQPVAEAPATELAVISAPPSAPEEVKIAPAPAAVPVTKAMAASEPVPSEATPTPPAAPEPVATVASTPVPEAAPAAAPAPVAAPAKEPEVAEVPKETPWLVRGDIASPAVKQGLLEKLLAEQKLTLEPQETPKDASEKAEATKTLRVRVVASGEQLKTLLAQMQEQSEAFSSLAVELPADAEANSSKKPEVRQASAASVVVEKSEKSSSSSRKANAPSRVLFDRDAPPPPPAERLLELPDGDARVARPILFELQIVPSETKP